MDFHNCEDQHGLRMPGLTVALTRVDEGFFSTFSWVYRQFASLFDNLSIFAILCKHLLIVANLFGAAIEELR